MNSAVFTPLQERLAQLSRGSFGGEAVSGRRLELVTGQTVFDSSRWCGGYRLRAARLHQRLVSENERRLLPRRLRLRAGVYEGAVAGAAGAGARIPGEGAGALVHVCGGFADPRRAGANGGSDAGAQGSRVASRLDVPFVEALGAAPIVQPINVVYQNLANGVIDGVVVSPSAIGSFKLQEPANYLTTWLPLSGTPVALLMNRDVYAALSPARARLDRHRCGRRTVDPRRRRLCPSGRTRIAACENAGVQVIGAVGGGETSLPSRGGPGAGCGPQAPSRRHVGGASGRAAEGPMSLASRLGAGGHGPEAAFAWLVRGFAVAGGVALVVDGGDRRGRRGLALFAERTDLWRGGHLDDGARRCGGERNNLRRMGQRACRRGRDRQYCAEARNEGTDVVARLLGAATAAMAALALFRHGACGAACGATTPSLLIVHTPFYYALGAAFAAIAGAAVDSPSGVVDASQRPAG